MRRKFHLKRQKKGFFRKPLAVMLLLLISLSMALPAQVFAAETMSAEFKQLLNEDGKLVLNSVKPDSKDDLDYILLHELYYEKGYSYDRISDDLSSTDLTIYTESGNEETHTVGIVYHYDESVKEQLKGLAESLPKEKDFILEDLALVKYTLDHMKNHTSEPIPVYYLKAAVNNDDIEIVYNATLGDGGLFYGYSAGYAIFKYNDIVYHVEKSVSTGEKNIIYVPDTTGDTKEALVEAAQQRINQYFGKDNAVTVSYGGTALEVWAKDEYENTRGEWEEANPNLTVDEWLSQGRYPANDDFGQDVLGLGIKGIDDDTPTFIVTIKVGNEESSYNFIIKKDSSKAATSTVETVNKETGIKLEAAAGVVPSDTVIQAEQVKEGGNFTIINNALKKTSDKWVAYDISLLSNGVEIQPNGKVKISIPRPRGLNMNKMVLYHVAEDGKLTQIPFTLDGTKDNILFETDHFSLYAVAEADEAAPDSSGNPDGTNTSQGGKDNPQTGDSSMAALWTAIMLFSAAAIVFITVKHRKSVKG